MENKMLAINQSYSQDMAQYFNPLQVVASVLAKIDLNPYAIRLLDVSFVLGDGDVYYNTVRVRMEFAYDIPDDWIAYFKDKLGYVLKDAFTTAYGKKADKKYHDIFGPPPSYFTREFDSEITPNKF